MNMVNKKGLIDVFGMVSSSLCAVHCLALPVLLSAGLFSEMVLDGHRIIEELFIVVTFFIAFIAIFKGYSGHRNPYIVGGILASFSLVIVGYALGSSSGHFLMAIGGIGLAVGHGYNRNLLISMQ